MDRPHVERVKPDLDLLVLPEVFPPSRFFTTRALIEALDLLKRRPGSAALDMGTGSGAAAIHLAKRGFVVDAVDINPSAVRCARANAIMHGVDERLTVHHGDLFNPVQGRRYDIIVFNPPYLDGTPARWLEHAFFGGEAGEVIGRFLADARDHLNPDGVIVFSYSTIADTARLDRQLKASRFEAEVLHRRDVVTEVVIHHLLRPTPGVPGEEPRPS